MSDIVADYFKLAVNVILNGVVIVLIVGTFALISVLTTAVRAQEVTNQKLAESAEYNQYTSGTAMRGSDVISTIMKYRDTLDIQVYGKDGSRVLSTWNDSVTYTLTSLSSIIPSSYTYIPECTPEVSGEITTIIFRYSSG